MLEGKNFKSMGNLIRKRIRKNVKDMDKNKTQRLKLSNPPFENDPMAETDAPLFYSFTPRTALRHDMWVDESSCFKNAFDTSTEKPILPVKSRMLSNNDNCLQKSLETKDDMFDKEFSDYDEPMNPPKPVNVKVALDLIPHDFMAIEDGNRTQLSELL